MRRRLRDELEDSSLARELRAVRREAAHYRQAGWRALGLSDQSLAVVDENRARRPGECFAQPVYRPNAIAHDAGEIVALAGMREIVSEIDRG